MKKTTRSFLQKPSTTGALIGVLLVAFSVVGLLLIQTPLEKPQDVRRQASIDNGQVTVGYGLSIEGGQGAILNNGSANSSQVVVGKEVEVQLAVDTHSVPTDGIQVLFNVVTDTFDAMTADVVGGGGLQAVGSEIERTSDGFLVQAIALPAVIGQPFVTTNNSVDFLKIRFTPTEPGTIAFNFDREESISIVHGSDPLEDKLNHVQPLTIRVVEENGEPGASPSPSPSPSSEPETSPSPSPSPSPDAIGGIQVVSCNQECSSNAECGLNQRCYNVDGTNLCRLAVNPTNDRCITADVGPNYSCNHGCADTHECAAGLTCWYNQCRDPLNVEDTSCNELTEEETASLAASCNASCESNNDCDINLRCYNGGCRLVTNPSSSSCSPATKKTTSSVYATPKGGTGTTSDKTTTKADEAQATPSAKASATPIASAAPIQDTEKTTSGTTLEETPISENETALDVLLTMMKSPDSALPLIIIGSGIGLLILALIIIAVRRLTGGSASPTPMRSPSGTTPTQTQKPEPVATRADMGTPLTTARSMTTPTASMPTQTTLQQQASAAQGMPPAATQPSASGQSSMMQRMKDKGISVPQTPSEPQK